MSFVTGPHEDRIGWGVLSTGHIASTFAADLALLPDEAALVAASSRSVERARDFAGKSKKNADLLKLAEAVS